MILPNDYINNSVETYHYSKRVKGQWLYLFLLAVCVLGFIALPFVRVDLTVNENGVIRSYADPAILKSVMTNQIHHVYVKEGDFVQEGDTLLTLCKDAFSNIQKEQHESVLSYLKAPVSGTLIDFSGLYDGNTIQSGQRIGMISPDSLMIVEAHVSPNNIAFIREGMPVMIQVDGFNYNSWGCAQGIVIHVSDDTLFDKKNDAYYKVKCSLYKNFLQLQTGERGVLKKGMSAQVHFKVATPSLYSMLVRNRDEWKAQTLN